MLTLVLATHNGGSTLAKTLDGFVQVAAPRGGWKLIVVNNASKDATQAILESYLDRLPLQILEQSKPGKNVALNSAIARFEGDLVVFTDDDVVAAPDWLTAMRDAADAHPDYDMFGGVIRPLWPAQPPDWLLDSIPARIVYGITHEDLRNGPVDPGRVWGANMAVRRTVFERGHRLNETVGPQPGQYRMGSETEFTVRLAKLGHRCWHCENALVHHIIRPAQLDPEWVIKRGFRFGRDMFWKENDPALAGDEKNWPTGTTLLFGLPRWYFTKYLVEWFHVALGRLTGNKRRWLKASWEVNYWNGYFHEAFGTGAEFRRNKGMSGNP